MGKIPAAKAAAMFEEIIGWPYELGGSGKTPGGVIDCSGAWVRVYRAFGKSIYHGSNRQYREYCSRTGTITGPGDLQVGMAVFKCRPWADEDRGHRDYGTAPGNIYHVGCVTSVNPLRIVHATPDFAKVDTKVGNWKYWGALKEVEYGMEETKQAPLYTATVATQSGALNLRASSPSGTVLAQIPRGASVEVLGDADTPGWLRVRYGGVEGVASADYLRKVEGAAQAPEDEPDDSLALGVGVFIPCGTAEQARMLAALIQDAQVIVD